jgi:hypothetical protein
MGTIRNLTLNLSAVALLLMTVTFGGPLWAQQGAEAASTFSYDDYATVLSNYVDDDGLVNYKNLKADRKALDAFAASLGRQDPKAFASWPDRDKIALWINAYNALTLVAIIDRYPIEWTYIRSLRFPKNSIRQIPGVWDEIRFPVMGRKMTLDDIEHRELRSKYNEPRIHMALVCAALGCPILRNEPFTGRRLDEQLDDQARRLLKDPKKFRLDRNQARVYLSSIFKWFGKDFVKTYGTSEKFTKFNESERAALNFVGRYIDPDERRYLEKGAFTIEYPHYDWTLNEKKGFG